MNKYLEDRIMEITQSEGQTESQIKRKKNESNVRDYGILWASQTALVVKSNAGDTRTMGLIPG